MVQIREKYKNKFQLSDTMNVNKSMNINKRKLDNEKFSWSDNEIQLLVDSATSRFNYYWKWHWIINHI